MPTARRNRLLPWYIGLAVVALAVAFVGFRMYASGCPAPLGIELIVLLLIPSVYLVLMYLTFVSQE